MRQRAYAIWEREGRPDGRASAHWERARRELGVREVDPESPPPDHGGEAGSSTR